MLKQNSDFIHFALLSLYNPKHEYTRKFIFILNRCLVRNTRHMQAVNVTAASTFHTIGRHYPCSNCSVPVPVNELVGFYDIGIICAYLSSVFFQDLYLNRLNIVKIWKLGA